MHLLRLRGFPILEQLQLEERLLRTTQRNWCLINQGTSPPAIVMGISGYVLFPFPKSHRHPAWISLPFSSILLRHLRTLSTCFCSFVSWTKVTGFLWAALTSLSIRVLWADEGLYVSLLMMELAKSLPISHFPQGWKHYSNSGLSATRVSVVS